MALAKLLITYMDHNRELSTVTVQTPALTAANIVATQTLFDNLQTAIQGIADGVLVRRMDVAEITEATPAPPGAGVQREIKWMARWHDVSGRKYRTEIPCADLSQAVANKDFIDLTAGAGLAFKTAFEAVVKGDDESAATLDDVISVYRNT